MSNVYRQIPAINAIVDSPLLSAWHTILPRSMIVASTRQVLAEYRAAVTAGKESLEVLDVDAFASWVNDKLNTRQTVLQPVINATGIIVHTGLGRAPLAEPVVNALAAAARHYAPVELNMHSGERGKRAALVQVLLCHLTGAEAATVVNNNAAALLLALTAMAKDREVIVSRGELIEIGGSFRLPDVMSASGALLREVGTTNKTRINDYAQAIAGTTAALLKVHPSNYRIQGFTEEASVAELVALAKQHHLPVIHDIGSGLLSQQQGFALADEPDACSAITAGVDLVLFSGDKLLGGPQAGIIVGKKAYIDNLEKHPLMRAMRVDKLTLTALAATLQLHQNPSSATAQIPVLRMLTATVAELEQRARQYSTSAIKTLEIEKSSAYLGGGALPAQAIPSIALRLPGSAGNEHIIARQLRMATPAVLPRIHHQALYFDLRTVFPEQATPLGEALHIVSGNA